MLKFFKKIRQKLINKGALTKYLLYALGEILLVVIGILIALQVNNWNQTMQQKKKEIKILQEIHENLQTNIQNFLEEIKKQDEVIQNIDLISYQLKHDIPFQDSMGWKYSTVAFSESYVIVNSAYESLKNLGFDIITSDSLKNRIIYLFSVIYAEGENVLPVGLAEYESLITPIYKKHIEFDKRGYATINDYEKLKKDNEFTNMLSVRRFWKSSLIGLYKKHIPETKAVDDMILSELKRLNKN